MVAAKILSRGNAIANDVKQVDGQVALAQPSDISLDLTASDVANYARVGDDLVITLADGGTLVVEDFFVVSAEGDVSRLFLGGEDSLAFVDLSAVGGEAYAAGSIEASSALSFDSVDVAGGVGGALPGIALDSVGGVVAGGIAAAGAVAAVVSGDSSPTAETTPADEVTTITGSVVAGPAVAGHGMIAEVFDASGNLLGTADLNDDGSFSVEITSDYSGSILVRVKDVNAGADYFDEGRATPIDLASDLRAVAVVDGSGNYVVNVNVLTELATRSLGLSGGDAGSSSSDLSGASAAAVTAANAAIASAHGLTGDLTSQAVNPVIDASGASSSSANLYGEVLAAYSGVETGQGLTLPQVLDAYGAGTLSDTQKLDLVSGAVAAQGDGEALASALGVENGSDVVAGLTAVVAAANGVSDGSTGLSAEQAAALGLGTLSAAELAVLNAAIDALPGTAVDTVAELQALAAAAVAQTALSAYEGVAPAPTEATYAAAGVTGVDSTNIDAVNALLADPSLNAAATDTAAEVQDLVNGLTGVLAGAGGAANKPTIDDLEDLGFTNVTEDNLPAIQAAIAAAGTAGVGTLAEIQDIVNDTVAAINALSGHEEGDADLAANVFEDAGVTGLDTGVANVTDAVVLAAVNDAIAVATDASSNSLEELQAITDGMMAVLDAAANGTANEPSLDDLTALGIEGVTDTNLPAIQAAIAATADDGSAVSTIEDLQNVVTAMIDVLATAAGEPADLSVEDLGLLGVVVTPDQLAAATAAIAGTNVNGTDVDTPAELLDLVTDAIAAQGNALTDISAYDGTGDAPLVQDYIDAGVTGVTDTNVAAMNSIIAPFLSGATDETAELQVIADALNNVIAGAAGTAPEAAPTITDLEALGFTNVDADNITAVQAVIAAAGVEGVEDLTEIQDLVNGTVDAVAQIAAYEEGTDPAPTEATYAAAGVEGVTDTNVAAVNSALAAAPDASSNSLEEIQALTNAMLEVLSGAAGEEGLPSAEALELLGIDITDPANLTAVQAAIAATDPDGSGVSTLADLQNVVDNGIIAAAAALDVISAYDGGVADTVPTEQDYTAAGVTGVEAADLALLNDVVADLAAAGTDTAAELQPLADAASGITAALAGTADEPSLADLEALGLDFVTEATLPAVQAAIAGADAGDVDSLSELSTLIAAAFTVAGPALAEISAYEGTGEAPSVQDYIDAGVTDVSLSNIDAVNALVAPLGPDATNSPAQLQDIVDGLNGVIAGATGTADVPALDQLEALGVPDVTEDNLSAIQAAIAATGDAALVDELSELLPLVAGVVAAVDTIAAYGETGAPAPDEATYEAAGVTGITDTNIDAVNNAIAAATTENSNSLEEIQALADAMIEVLDAAANGTADVPSLEALQLLGIEDVDADNLVAIQAAIAATNPDGSEVSDLADLQTIVTAMADVADAANNETTNFTNDDLAVLGITVSDDEFPIALAAIVASNDDGSGVNSPAAIQELITEALEDLRIISEYDGNNEAPNTLSYAGLGISGVSPVNATVVQNMIAALDPDQTDSIAEIQAVVDAVDNLLLAASGTAGVPTIDDLAALGFDNVTEEALPAIQLAIEATDDSGNGVSDWTSLRDLINGAEFLAPTALAALTAYEAGDAEPTPLTYTQAGVSGVDGDNVAGMNDILAAFDETATATLEQIQALADAMNAVRDGAAGEAGKPELADLQLLGITDVSEDNIAAVQAAIEATDDNGDGVDTLQELQDLVTGVTGAIDTISAYTGGLPAPDAAAYSAAGVTGVDDGTNIDAVNALIAGLSSEEKDTAEELQDLVDGLNGVLAGAAGTADLPTLEQLEALGFENVTLDNLSAVQNAIAGTNPDGSEVSDLGDLQTLVNGTVAAVDALSSFETGGTDPILDTYTDAGVTGLDTVIATVPAAAILAAVNDAVAVAPTENSNSLEELQAITDGMIAVLDAAANGTAGNTTPTLANLEALGFEGITEAMLPALQDAIAATAADGSGVDTIDDLTLVVGPIVDAMGAIAAFDGSQDPLADTVYADAGVTGVTGADVVAAMNNAIAAAASADSDSLAEMQAIADAVVSVQTLAVSGDPEATAAAAEPSVTTLELLGVEGLSADTLLAMQNAIAQTPDGTAVDTLDELQALADAVIAVHAGATGTAGVPTQADLELLGVNGLDEATFSTVQAAIAATGDGAAVDSLLELQTIADDVTGAPFIAALATVSGYDGTPTVPTVADYEAISVTGVVDPDNLGLVNEVVAGLPLEDTDTTGEVQNIVNAVQAVLDGAAGTVDEPTLADLQLLGIENVTEENIADVRAIIAATDDGGADVATLAAIQSVVDDGLAAVATLTAYDGSQTDPVEATYATAGVTGVSATNVEDVNSFVEALETGATDSVAEIQAIVEGVDAVVNAADTSDGSAVTLDNLLALGITGASAANLALVQAAIAAEATGADVDTLTELQAVVDSIPPSVVGVTITSDAGDDNTYGENDVIQFTAEMTEAVTIDTTGGTPTLEITVGTTTQQATYVSGSGTQNLVFEYTVQLRDLDGNGVDTPADAISLNGATAVDATGNVATLTHAAVVASVDHLVEAPAPFTGSVIEGNVEEPGRFGNRILGIGDFNGDGLDDILISQWTFGGGSVANDKLHIVYGTGNTVSPLSIDEITADPARGFTITNDLVSDFTLIGFEQSALGDVNGDGFDDFSIGFVAFRGSDKTGGYVVFGSDEYQNILFSDLIADPNFVSRINNPSPNTDRTEDGRFTISVGDVNGDGINDILTGDGNDTTRGANAGIAHLVYGVQGAFDVQAALDSADQSRVVSFTGEADDFVGYEIDGIGDINNDGYSDLFFASYSSNNNGANSGGAYVVFGGTDLQNTHLPDGNAQGFRIEGAGAGEGMGNTGAHALGDINGDGIDDFAVAATNASSNGFTNNGRLDVIFGSASHSDFTASSGGLPADKGFSVFGSNDNARIYGTTALGDVNNDGFGDFGIRGNTASGGSFAQVVFGGDNLTSFSLADFNNYQGFEIIPDSSTGSINFGGSAGDLNGDGIDDLVISAYQEAVDGVANVGKSYVIYGGNELTSINLSGIAAGDGSTIDYLGTDVSDSWRGSALSESAVSGQGNDILVGNGGADVLLGGTGDDTFILNADNVAQLSAGIVNNQRAKVDGGTGTDELQLDGAGIAFDLTTIGDDRLEELEIIDISGSGANSLVMTLADVKAATDVANTLRIDGDSDDVVTLVDYTATGASEVISGVTYNAFEQLGTKVLVQDGVGIATSVGGTVVAGPVSAPLSVTLYDEAGTMLAQTTTDSDGGFSINGLQYTGNMLVVVEDTNGTAADYTDEFTGEAVDLSVPLRAVVDYTGHKTDLSVTPMTELAVRLMGVTGNAAPTGTLPAEVNAALSTTFGVTDLLGNAEPVNGGNFASASDAAQSYGMQLAGLSALDGLYGSMEIALDRIEAGLDVVTNGSGTVTAVTLGSELQALSVPVADALNAYVAEPDIADGPAAALASLLGDGVVIGSDAADDRDGTAGTDIFALAGGDDVVTHSAGDDYVFGGEGSDTLNLDGQTGVTIDLSRLSSIETVDLTGTGDNTLNLSLEDLTDNVGTTVEFVVSGDAGDTVNLTSSGNAWAASGTTNDIGGVIYDGYVAGSVTTWIEQDVTAVI